MFDEVLNRQNRSEAVFLISSEHKEKNLGRNRSKVIEKYHRSKIKN